MRAHEPMKRCEPYLFFWRQVDVTLGQWMGTCWSLWNANDLSDGWFVESKLMDRNLW
jgi:hypothetical protein